MFVVRILVEQVKCPIYFFLICLFFKKFQSKNISSTTADVQKVLKASASLKSFLWMILN